MKWTEVATEDLRKYTGLKASIGNIAERVEALELKFVGIKGSQTDREPITGGGGSHWEEFMLDNIVERDRLRLLLAINRKLAAVIERGLSALNWEERLTLEYFFINRPANHVEKLKDELKLEQSAVYRLRDYALHKFTVHMYGIAEY